MLMPLPGLRRFTHLQYAVSALGLGSGALARNAKPLAGTQIIRMIESGALPIDEIVTHRMPLKDYLTGIELVRSGLTSVKVALEP